MRTNARTFPAAEIVPEGSLAPIELESVFGRIAPLEVDLGCGDGTFLAALAEKKEERNFIGIERLVGRVRSACRKIGDRELENARIVHADILHALQHFIPPRSVEIFYLMFPDPWPKRRHQSRRTFSVAFLRAIEGGLTTGGALRVATDDTDYFRAMQRIVSEVAVLRPEQEAATWELPRSTFEARFHQRGLKIHRLVLRKG